MKYDESKVSRPGISRKTPACALTRTIKSSALAIRPPVWNDLLPNLATSYHHQRHTEKYTKILQDYLRIEVFQRIRKYCLITCI